MIRLAMLGALLFPLLAPAALTALSTVMICSSDSTEQGPAIMQKLPPPMDT